MNLLSFHQPFIRKNYHREGNASDINVQTESIHNFKDFLSLQFILLLDLLLLFRLFTEQSRNVFMPKSKIRKDLLIRTNKSKTFI